MAHIPSKYKTIGSRTVALGHLSAGMAQDYACMQSTFTQTQRIA